MKHARQLISIMLCFCTMGSLDLIGLATNYFKVDLALTGFQAGLLPGMMYVWFLLLSVPTGGLMNRMGRKTTVLIALTIICLSLILALTEETRLTMFAAIGLLGIGDTILVVSLNPLTAAMTDSRRLPSTLTSGQCAKAIFGMLAPPVASWGLVHATSSLDIGWRTVFVMFLAISIPAAFLLAATPIDNRQENATETETTVKQCLRAIRHPAILMAFAAVFCHVGSDMGINLIAPRLFIERIGWSLDKASTAISVYLAFRLVGALSGILYLQKLSIKQALTAGIALLALGLAGAFISDNTFVLYTSMALLGAGNANICTLIMSQAFISVPEQKNTTSALLTMALSGGAVIPIITGSASNAFGLKAAIAIICACVAFVAFYTLRIPAKERS